jgi:two-component system, OmpR family, sensor histidine kinase CiaH
MNMKNLHWDARKQLAATYLSIILVLTLGFSVVFYHATTRAAGAGLRRQSNRLRENIFFAPPGVVDRIRSEGEDNFSSSVKERLIFIDLGMLIAGGFVSYYLAKRSLEPLENAMIAQGRFTSDAAHELRTPLTAMKTEIEVGLRDKKLTTEDARMLLASNLEEIAKLETLTDALLRLAKNGHQPDINSWKDINISSVLSAAFERVKPSAVKSNINFVLPVASELSINGDHEQLVELFVILFDNAIKYGVEKTEVTVTSNQVDNELIFTVADKGLGIAESDLPHIFERFYRADHSRNKQKADGYGLGLSMAEAIVKSHNGTISADSTPGTGTTFTVTLPYLYK